MAKEKLAAVRDLISQKRFSEARAILETIDDDPMAQKLLDQLNRKAPRSRPRGSGGGVMGYIVTVLVSAVLTIALIGVLIVLTVPSNPASARIVASSGNDNSPAATQPPTATPLPLVTVGEVQSNQSVNLRSGPGTNFDRLGSLNAGVQVTVIGANEDSSWLNIRLPDSSEGWIRADLLATSEVSATLTPEGAQEVAQAESTVDEATALPTCTPEEALTWWEDHPLYFTVGHAALTLQENPEVDYAALKFRLQDGLYNFDIADSPPCIATVRQNVLDGGDAVVAALDQFAAGNADAGNTQLTEARADYLTPTVDLLQSEWGIPVSVTDCGAEFWYGSLRLSFRIFTDMVNNVDTSAANSDTIRTDLFRLQELQREIAGYYYPLCATNAHASLIAAMDDGVSLYRAVFEGNQNAIQDARTSGTANLRALSEELARLAVAE